MNVVKNFVLCKTGTTLLQAALCCILIGIGFGCVPVPPTVGQGNQTFPILYGILAEDRSTGISEYRIAAAQEWRQIRVIRRGVRLDVTPNMTLETGDRIRTGSGMAAAIRFPNGSQLYIRSNTHIKIGSVFAFVGELFVRVKGNFRVDTEFVTAGAEGTEWVMTISPNGDTRCIVLEGRITVASNKQLRKPMSVGANNQGVTGTVWDMTSVPPDKISKIKNWISQIDSLVR